MRRLEQVDSANGDAEVVELASDDTGKSDSVPPTLEATENPPADGG